MRVKRDPVPETQALVPTTPHQYPASPAPYATSAYPLLSQELQEDVFVAGMLARSGFFPNTADEAQAFAKMQLGRELGIGRATSMRELYVVQGRLAMSATLIGALIRRTKVYDYKVPKIDNEGCVVDVYKNGEFIGRSQFMREDAEAAGLLGKENYKKWIRNMYWSRAMSNAGRWFCPELFVGGVYTPDELGLDIPLSSPEDVISVETLAE